METLSDKRSFTINREALYTYEEFDGSCPNQIAVYLAKDVKEVMRELKEG